MRSIVLAAAVVAVGMTSSLAACGASYDASSGEVAEDGGNSDASGSSGSSGTSSSSGSGTSSSSGGLTDGGVDAPVDARKDAGAECNAIAQAATVSISVLTTTAPAPTAAGGTVVSGTYVLTDAKAHTNVGGNGIKIASLGRQTIEVTGTSVQELQTDDKDAVQRFSGTAAINGVDFVLTRSCAFPATADNPPQNAKFTATATTLTLLSQVTSPLGSFTVELTFTKK
jgi:hypothetical protein